MSYKACAYIPFLKISFLLSTTLVFLIGEGVRHCDALQINNWLYLLNFIWMVLSVPDNWGGSALYNDNNNSKVIIKVTCSLWFRFWLCEVCVGHKVVNSYKTFDKMEARAQSKPEIWSSGLSWAQTDFWHHLLQPCILWLLRMHRNSRSSNIRPWSCCLFLFSTFRYAFFSCFVFLFVFCFASLNFTFNHQMHRWRFF